VRIKPGSVGVLAPNTEALIVDPATGEAVGHDVQGELWVRGPQVMAGYLNNPAATASTVDGDGWLHTGDLGWVDVDGYFFITDRIKEFIKYKGFQVPPAELEGLLLTHSEVTDAAVIGRPDEKPARSRSRSSCSPTERGRRRTTFVRQRAGRPLQAPRRRRCDRRNPQVPLRQDPATRTPRPMKKQSAATATPRGTLAVATAVHDHDRNSADQRLRHRDVDTALTSDKQRGPLR